MASFTDYLTVEGERMLAKAVAGTKVSFTKAVMGSGYLPSGTYEKNVSAVMTPEQEVPIQSVTINSSSSVLISAYFSNKNLDKGFYFREKALYMSDGTDEVLAIYGNNGADAEYIDKGDACVIEKLLKSVIELTSQEMANIEIVSGLYEFAPIIESEETSLEDFVKTVQAKAIRMGQRVIINKLIAYTYVGDDPTDTGSYITGARMSDEYKVKLAGGDAKGGIGASQHALVDVHEEAVAADEKATAAAEEIANHMADKSNPHEVTAEQIGALTLQKIIDDLEELKALTEKGFVPDALLLQSVLSTLSSHVADKSNPHGVTKAQVGLGNCDNTADVDKSVKYASIAGTLDGFSDYKNQTPVQAGEEINNRWFYLGFNGGDEPVYAVPVGDMTVGNASKLGGYDPKHYIKNAYADNASFKQGIKFDKNVSGNLFTFRPDLSRNLMQITLNDAKELVRIDENGNLILAGDLGTSGLSIGLNALVSNYLRTFSTGGIAYIGQPMTGGTAVTRVAAVDTVGTKNYVPIYAKQFLNSVGDTLTYDDGSMVLRARSGAQMRIGATQVVVTNNSYTAYTPIQASSFDRQSSRLVKENISDMRKDEMDKILEIRVVDFDYKSGFGEKGQHGVIAEQVEDVIPYAVTTPDGYQEEEFDESKGINQKIKSVDYSKFVPYLIAKIQEQEKRIEALEER